MFDDADHAIRSSVSWRYSPVHAFFADCVRYLLGADLTHVAYHPTQVDILAVSDSHFITATGVCVGRGAWKCGFLQPQESYSMPSETRRDVSCADGLVLHLGECHPRVAPLRGVKRALDSLRHHPSTLPRVDILSQQGKAIVRLVSRQL